LRGANLTGRICADTLAQHEEDFAPFCEYSKGIPDFETYCEHVRSSAEWGGHLELRALSLALKRPVWIYSASASSQPLVIDAADQVQDEDANDPIRLSYHRHYYALGEHYNQVVPS
jgi:OTU domain-containing protein 6